MKNNPSFIIVPLDKSNQMLWSMAYKQKEGKTINRNGYECEIDSFNEELDTNIVNVKLKVIRQIPSFANRSI